MKYLGRDDPSRSSCTGQRRALCGIVEGQGPARSGRVSAEMGALLFTLSAAPLSSFRRAERIMNKAAVAGIVMAGAALTGCASTGVGHERGEQDFSSKIRRGVPSMLIGDARVVGSHVDPMGPLQVSSEAGGVAIRYTGP